jgi:hypothetical protein
MGIIERKFWRQTEKLSLFENSKEKPSPQRQPRARTTTLSRLDAYKHQNP